MALGTTGMAVAAALVAGVVGAGTAAVIVGSRSPAPPAPGTSLGETAALEERLAKQEKEIQALRARLEEAAQARPAAAAEGTGKVVVGEGELHLFDAKDPKASPGEAAAAGPGAPADLASLTPEERTKFESVYKALRAKEQEDARRARAAAQEAALRGRLDRLPENVALSDAQKDTVVKVLAERGEKLRLVFEDARTSGGGIEAFRAAQEKATAVRQEYAQVLAQSLTQDQVKAVEQVADRGAAAARTGTFGGRGGAATGVGGRRNSGGAGGAGGGATQPPK